MNRLCALALFAALPMAGLAEDWPQFRGPKGQASATAAGLPTEFGPDKNVKWKVELPGRGLSCPVIAGGKLFLTASSGMDDTHLHALAFDPATGAKLWERSFWATGQTFCHEKTCMACPTCVAEGGNVYCLFATGDVAALSADGDVRWVRSLAGEFPKMANLVGRSSSPVIAGGVLAVLMENQGDSYLFAIDPATGATKWKAERPADNNWSTPLAFDRGNDYGWEIVIQAANGITAYDAKNGNVRWVFDKEKLNQIVTPVAKGEQILAMGWGGLFALNPGGATAEVAWKGAKLRSDNPTPVVVGDRIYSVSRPGILKCGDFADGKQLWDVRIPGTYWSSPIYADGKIFIASEEGKVSVVKPDAEPKVLAVNDLKEPLLATPAVYGNAIYFRSDKHLWCFGSGKDGASR